MYLIQVKGVRYVMSKKSVEIFTLKSLDTDVITEDKSEDIGYVKLPFSETKLNDFIISLLGQPQTMEGMILGDFIVDLSIIDNLTYIFEQRVGQQNNGKLIQFIAKIYYDNGDIITISGLDSFKTYKNLKSNTPITLDITWAYLIQFNDKSSPEKQTINIQFITDNIQSIIDCFESTNNLEINGARIKYKIDYTARTWGVDMDFIIKESLKKIVIKNRLKSFLSTKIDASSGNTVYVTYIITGIFAFLLILIYGSVKNIINKKLEKETINLAHNIINSMTDINEKIDYIINLFITSSNNHLKVGGVSNMVMILVFLVCVFVMYSLLSRLALNIGFIVLDEQTEKAKKELKDLYKAFKLEVVKTFIGSVITSAIANYIFLIISRIFKL